MSLHPVVVDSGRQIQRIARETDWRAIVWGVQGLGHLALHSAAELTDLVTEMDGTIRQAPLPLGQVEESPRQRAPWPYRLVAHVFRTAAGLLQRLPLQADIRQSHALALPLLSAANGVLGDKLERWQSPLALGMTLRDEDSETLAWSQLATTPKARVSLFIHGLCWSEREWQTPAQKQFQSLLQNKGWTSGWLRYNSGRNIWRNGADLSDWLEEALAAHPVKELVLVGHSQGGLLIRSAFAHAEAAGHAWPERVSRAAYLATPHQGAPLERAGRWANALLSHSPYTQPLMRLGNIRSAAIKDLRYGVITEAEAQGLRDDLSEDPRQQAVTLPDHVSHLFLAGSLNPEAAENWLGDGLVPVHSGLGLHRREALALNASDLSRVELDRMDHMNMLGDVRVWDALADWWWKR